MGAQILKRAEPEPERKPSIAEVVRSTEELTLALASNKTESPREAEKPEIPSQEKSPRKQGGDNMTEETKFATKEEVQREHKDLRTFILSKGSFLIGSLALLLAIALFWVSQGVNSKIDAAEKSLKAEITSVGTKIDANEKVAAIRFDAQQKQMDGIQQHLASMNAVLADIQKNSHK